MAFVHFRNVFNCCLRWQMNQFLERFDPPSEGSMTWNKTRWKSLFVCSACFAPISFIFIVCEARIGQFLVCYSAIAFTKRFAILKGQRLICLAFYEVYCVLLSLILLLFDMVCNTKVMSVHEVYHTDT